VAAKNLSRPHLVTPSPRHPLTPLTSPDHGRTKRPPRRLLVAGHSGCQGGAELCLDTTLRHLNRTRYEADVLFGCEGPMVESARAIGYPVEVLPLGWWMCYDHSLWHYKNALGGSLPRIWQLVRRIKRRKIDLVYSNTAVIYEAALAARLAGVPHVWHVHEVLTGNHMRPRMLPLGLIRRLISGLSDRVIFESDASREICRGAMPGRKMQTVYNSVRPLAASPALMVQGEAVGWDKRSAGPPSGPEINGPEINGGPALRLSHPTPAGRPDARARFDLADDRCAVVWIGRFSQRKNPLMLIRAVARMKTNTAARCRFLFVGEGPLEEEMAATIGKLGLADRCRLVPFQEEVRPVLEAADLLVLTSQEESFGLVLVEAAAHEKPVVATRTQGPAEIVVDGQTGVLVDTDDEAALAAALDELAADPQKRETMGRAAARRAAQRFSPVANTRQIESVFDEVLGARGGERGAPAP